MEHEEAIQLKASERYLLGELTSDLREQFESHYFSCAECARDVEAGAAFLDGAREILVTESVNEPVAAKPKVRPPKWFDFILRPALAVPAFAALLLFAVYQNTIMIPHMRAAISDANEIRVLPSYSLMTQNSRGGESTTIHVSPKSFFSLFLDIPPEKQFPAYTCDFEAESGSPEYSLTVPADQAASNLQFLIPSSRLGPGKHVLVVRGAETQPASQSSETEVARFEFTLEFSK